MESWNVLRLKCCKVDQMLIIPGQKALAIAADTGLVAKACRRMSGKRAPQGNAQTLNYILYCTGKTDNPQLVTDN